MNSQLDRNAILAAFEMPDINGVYNEQYQTYFRLLTAGRPLLLLAFAPKSAGTFLRQVAIDVLGGYLLRGVQAQGGRDGAPYLPHFIAAYRDGSNRPPVAHMHMQALPANRNFIETLGLRPAIMIRSIPDMLASYWDMLERDPIARNDGLNCLIPGDFVTKSGEEKADFLIDMLAPWYATYYATWRAYVEASPGQVCVLHYRDLSTDPAKTIHAAITHAGFTVSRARCEAAVEKHWVRKSELRFNQGKEGRGAQYFSREQLVRLARTLSHYREIGPWREQLLGQPDPIPLRQAAAS